MHAHRNASIHVPELKLKRRKKLGVSRGDNPVVAGLANYERAVCRVARLGGLPSGISRFIAPQRRRWDDIFLNKPCGGD